nr:bifunctional protein GlmU-like [Nerophis lumbriciformis]
MKLEIIVLAAGQGTRMQSSLPKVLHPVGGKPMLMRVLDCAASLSPEKIHVVTGFKSQQIEDVITQFSPKWLPSIIWANQTEQNGTGHAVMQAMPNVDPASRCLILFGDVPLADSAVLSNLVRSEATLALLTATPENREGLGRILRDERNHVTGIVEQKDATEIQKCIGEINTGMMMCEGEALAGWLNRLGNDNSQREYYLTDIVALAVADSKPVDAIIAEDPDRFIGVNSKRDLATAERYLQKLLADQLMRQGVTITDPARIDIRGSVDFGHDCSVDINVIFEGDVSIGSNVTIEANCIIRDSNIGDHSHVYANSLVQQASLGKRCHIGPYARLRPDTVLEDDVRIGNFVEVKKSHIAKGSKANHLAYVGDSTVGKDVNIGAGVITCNYDGANKYQTIIGDGVFVGSDSQLVAPVTIESGATIGAGATITRNVAAGDLAISRARQTAIKNWRRPVKKK